MCRVSFRNIEGNSDDYYDLEDEDFLDFDPDELDVDLDDDDTTMNNDPVMNFRFHATFNENQNDGVDLEERPLEESFQENYAQQFDYLTGLLHNDSHPSFSNYSEQAGYSLPEFGFHKTCIIPLRVPPHDLFYFIGDSQKFGCWSFKLTAD